MASAPAPQLPIGALQHAWAMRGISVSAVPDSLMIEVNDVRGFLLPGDIVFLWQVGVELPPGARYLEIGSWLGLSAITVANGLVANLNLDARVQCVDTWQGSGGLEDQLAAVHHDPFEAFLANVRQARMEHFIQPLRGRSVETAASIPDRSLDAVFVDGDHSYEGCRADLAAWYPKLRQTGRMFGHDVATGNHHQIDARRQFGTTRAERFAQQPLPAIAENRVAHFARDRQSQTCMGQFVLATVHDHHAVRHATTPSIRTLEIGPATDSVFRLETQVGHLRVVR